MTAARRPVLPGSSGASLQPVSGILVTSAEICYPFPCHLDQPALAGQRENHLNDASPKSSDQRTAALKPRTLKFLFLPPLLAVCLGLAQFNFLFFHAVIEIFTVFVAWGIFTIAWNSRPHQENHYLLFLGIAYLHVGALDLLHTLTYKGMGIFSVQSADAATQLWIAARYTEALSLLAAPHFLRHRLKIRPTFSAFIVIVLAVSASILIWPIFPSCYVEGSGLSDFKKGSEYLIAFVFLLAFAALHRRRQDLDPAILRLMGFSILISIAAELTFTVYHDVYGILNQIGHICKFASFYLIYRAIIRTGLVQPFDLLFRDLKRSEERFRNVFDTAPIAFVLWDREHRITGWNQGAEQTFGWKAEEVIGRDLFEILIPPPARAGVKEVVSALTNGKLISRNINENLTKSGKIITCEWNNSLQYDRCGNVNGALSLGIDITERLQGEETAKRNSEKIKRFAYSVAHDLKTPSIALQLMARQLCETSRARLDEKGRRYCELIEKSSDQLIALVDEINSYIDAENSPLAVEPLDIREMSRTIREEFAERLARQKIVWSEPMDLPSIPADRVAVLRCLRNLVDNALKYGGAGLKTIAIGYREYPEHHVITLSDDGVGVRQESEKRVFQAFARDDSARGTTGSGLGLAIVREIAARHGGDAWMETGAERGVTFLISLSKYLQRTE